MTVSMDQLNAASAGPPMTKYDSPRFLSIGNSLMWGQGLRPDHRFRELVRSRIEHEKGMVVELSMARSGAVMEPQGLVDDEFHDGLMTTVDIPLSPFYSPENFAREMPHGAMSIQRQLSTAREIIDQRWGTQAHENVHWILLDGGINDVGIFNILTPFRAELDGYVLRCWPTWLLDEAKRIENLMVETLIIALKNFPSATIIVNGYFPILSLFSIASVTKLRSVGFLHGISNLVLTSPFGLDALANASAAWQVASTHHLRRAISSILRIAEYANRTVLFARSNIEGPHCLFGPDTWLWGYDAIPDSVPENVSQWVQWLAAATPEDEVILQRIDQCNTNQPDFTHGIPCRLASIGHPNVAGAVDYAESIIHEMERAGVLQTTDPACVLTAHSQLTSCKLQIDERNYACVRLDAAACRVCSQVTNAVAGVAVGLVKDGANRLGNAAKNATDAAECFKNTQSEIGQAAAGQFNAAVTNFIEAGNHFAKMADCWNNTQNSFQNCDDERAAKIAECNRAYENRVDTTCNIQCNSFTNCNRFGRFNPRRYICRAARAVCVTAAAAARAVCVTAAVAIRESCKVVAEAESVVCKGAEVVENTGCTLSEGGQGIWEGTKGIGHVFAGVGLALGALGGNFLCALGNGAKGLGNVFLGTLEVGFGIGVVGLGVAVPLYLGCTGARWMVNRSCRIFNWSVGSVCQLGSTALGALCIIWNTISRPIPQLPKVP